MAEIALIDEIKEENYPAIYGRAGLDHFYEKVREEVSKEVPDLKTAKGRARIASLASNVSKSKVAVEKPGPWELHESGAIVGPKIDDEPIWLRPVIARFETGVKREDALLIAAAPDLYAALQLAKDMMLAIDLYLPKTLDVINAALKRARGEE